MTHAKHVSEFVSTLKWTYYIDGQVKLCYLCTFL